MKAGPIFFQHSEWEEFQEQNRFVPRSILKLNNHASAKPQAIVDTLLGEFRKLTDGFGCWSVSVGPSDGASWTAERIRQELSKVKAHYRCICLRGLETVDGMPTVAQVVGEKTLLKLAAKRKVTTSFLTLRSWVTPVILATALLLALGTRLLEVMWKVDSPQAAGQVGQSFSKVSFWIVGIACAVVGLVAQHLTTWMTTKTKSKSMDKFLANLSGLKNTTEYSALIDDIVEDIAASPFPRLVIIDHFERLDAMSKEVINRYFRAPQRAGRGSEFWVVFEHEDTKEFSRLRDLTPHGFGYKNAQRARLAALDFSEKLKLVELLNLDERAAEFHSVKHVCNPHKANQFYENLFQEYRQHHPENKDRYGDLEFLYLMAATAVPCEVRLTDRFLQNNFIAKSGLQASLLRQILPGTKLIKSEWGQQTQAMRGTFKSALIDDAFEQAGFRVAPEAAAALLAKPEDLKLPRPSLMHLFWAVFWHEAVSRQAGEAVWVRKLAHHILGADVSTYNGDEGELAIETLADAAIFTIRGCLRACILAPIPDLIQKAVLLLDDLPPEKGAKHRAILAELSGGVYMILGNQAALETFLGLNSALIPKRPVLAQTGRNDFVIGELEPALRDFVSNCPPDIWQSSSVRQLRLRASWLVLTIFPVLFYPRERLFQETLESSFEDVNEIYRSVEKQAQGPPLRTVDRTNLVIALWCWALQLRVCPTEETYALLLKLAGFAENCLALTTPKDTDRISGYFVTEAVSRDVAVTAAAALVMGCHLIRDLHGLFLREDVDLRVKEVFSKALVALGYEAANPNETVSLFAPKTSSLVDELMDLCTVMWHTLGMDQMRHFMTVRRAHFDSLCRRTGTDDSDETLLHSEGAILDGQGFTALIANCVAADSLKDASELKTFYLSRAASIALSNNFGTTLGHELSQLVIRHAHTLAIDLSPFLRPLLDADDETSVASRLREVDDKDFSGLAIVYLNAADDSRDETLKGRTRAVIQNELDLRENTDHGDVKFLLALHKMQDEARLGKSIDAESVLATWKDHSDSWLFPALLRFLYGQTRSEALLPECFSALNHDASKDTNNCCLLLAGRLAQDLDDAHAPIARVTVEYLKNTIRYWRTTMSASWNVQIYRDLHRLDPANGLEYLRQVEYWQAIETHRDHLKRLPALLAEHQFFLLFIHYFKSNFFWGLRADSDPQALGKRLRASGPEAAKAISDWKKHGGIVPPAFKAADNKTNLICSDFLALGTYLFEPPLAWDHSMNETRRRFDMEAESGLLKLLRMIMELPPVPVSIKSLLRSHSERLYHYSLPQDSPLQALNRAAAS